MAKKQWTTTAQREWLETLIPAFIRAQQDRATPLFFEGTYSEWHRKWPTSAPTKEELADAGGSAEKILASKQKATESRIKFWFHNHTRGSSSGAGTRGVLKLNPKAKLVQPWQAYLNKFQSTKLKKKIEDAWQECLKGVPEGEKPQKTLFEIRNKLAQKLYASETAAVKEEVEEHRKYMMSGGKQTSDVLERNKIFQGSISKLPRTIQGAVDAIAEQTGWHALVIMGGPHPLMGGKITTLAFHEGKTTDGRTFETFLGSDYFDKKIMSKFDEFLHEAFDEEECAARAIHAESVGDSSSSESSQSEESEDDERTNKKAKLRVNSVKPSIDLEAQKAKMFAKNKKLLLEVRKRSRATSRQVQDVEVLGPSRGNVSEREPKKREGECEPTPSQPNACIRTETTIDSDNSNTTDIQPQRDLSLADSLPSPSPTARSQPAVNTAKDTAEEATLVTQPSADNACRDADSNASKNVRAQSLSAKENLTSGAATTTLATPPADNAHHDADSHMSEDVATRVPSTTKNLTPGAATTTLATPPADNAHDGDDADSHMSENVATRVSSATETLTPQAANAMATTLATPLIDNACRDGDSDMPDNATMQFPRATGTHTAQVANTAATTLERPPADCAADNTRRDADSDMSDNATTQFLSVAGTLAATMATGTPDGDSGSQLAQDGRSADAGTLQDSTSSAPFDDGAASLSDSSYKDTWFAPWFGHFRKVSTDTSWQALVTRWAQYELLNPPDGRLSTVARPEEVHWWIKRKRPLSLVPPIKKPSDFGAAWMLWWVKLQPAWREGKALVKSVPANADWEPVFRGGSNGLLLTIVALSWWVSVIDPDDQYSLLLEAINDVSWVLSELVSMLPTASLETSKKHSLEVPNQEEPKTKK